MPRFFTQAIVDNVAVIEGEDARHICKVLRMREGEALTVCDMAGYDYHCRLEGVSPEQVTARVLEKEPCKSEPPIKVRLFQALPKGDKLDFIVQKATELGVDEIVPVLTGRCVSRPGEKEMEKKRRRLQKIAYEAAKQSGRGRIPQVASLHSFRQAIFSMKEAELPILFYERASQPLRPLLEQGGASVAVLVGSEGGFSPEEADYAKEQGVWAAGLGSRILRCETAAVCALSLVFYGLDAM